MSKLKQIREEKNLTQEELSALSGISVRTIQRIEAGTLPKGHTLKSLSKSLSVPQSDLLLDETVSLSETEIVVEEKKEEIDFSKIKLINLSSILFVILPPLNILAPLILSYWLKEKNTITRQIISLQILWTIFAPIIFFIGIFLKLGKQFTLVLMIAIILSNVYLILMNTFGLDRKKELHYKLNFSIL